MTLQEAAKQAMILNGTGLWTQTNPLLAALDPMPKCLRWTRKFRPKWIHTFTEIKRPPNGIIYCPARIEHGYYERHPLGFIHKIASNLRRRNTPRFDQGNRIQGRSFEFKLFGNLGKEPTCR